MHPHEIVLRHLPRDWMNAQFWLSPFSAEDLESWWLSRPTLEWPLTEDDKMFYKMGVEVFGEGPPQPPTEIPAERVKLPGQLIDAEGEGIWQLFDQMARAAEHYECVFCCDSDSFLRRPDGTYLFHKACSRISKPWPIYPRLWYERIDWPKHT